MKMSIGHLAVNTTMKLKKSQASQNLSAWRDGVKVSVCYIHTIKTFTSVSLRTRMWDYDWGCRGPGGGAGPTGSDAFGWWRWYWEGSRTHWVLVLSKWPAHSFTVANNWHESDNGGKRGFLGQWEAFTCFLIKHNCFFLECFSWHTELLG